MRRLILGMILGLGFAGTAAAADVSEGAATNYVAPPQMDAQQFWNRWYAGGNLGYGHADWTISYYDFQVPAGGSKTVGANGWFGGVQIGKNWQKNSLVFGIEGDFQGSSLATDQQGGFSFDSCGCFDVSLKSFGTVRGRIGWLPTPRLLIYGTGGAVLGNLFYSVADSSPDGSADIWALGWVAGVGAEYMIHDNISLKAEWLHMDFGSPHYDFGTARFNTNVATSGDIGRFGINVHF